MFWYSKHFVDGSDSPSYYFMWNEPEKPLLKPYFVD